jgi:hypothetical protein
MPIAKLKYLVANGDLATGNFAPCLRDMVCLRYICVNTLHKGDSIFTNNNNNNNNNNNIDLRDASRIR